MVGSSSRLTGVARPGNVSADQEGRRTGGSAFVRAGVIGGKARRILTPEAHSFLFVSMQIVTGPSLTRSIFMCAPKTPRRTGLADSISSW